MIFYYEITVKSGEKFHLFVPSNMDIDLKAEWIHGMYFKFSIDKYNKYPVMNKYIMHSIRTSEIVCASLIRVEDRVILKEEFKS